mmetsp:Transcript_59883/g.68087  ORF Transcript_59883/g.68087 Transcript_59883/m.68087 type:complete len:246 (-) Transcript_59883:193-930(-)
MKLVTEEEITLLREKHETLSREKELSFFHETCTSMVELGQSLFISQEVVSLSMLIFQRFLLKNSFKNFDRLLLGAVCVFTAAKLEDTPRQLDQVVNHYYLLKYKRANRKAPEMSDTQKTTLKDKFCDMEIRLLTDIGFDLNIDLPYQFLHRYKDLLAQHEMNILAIANGFVNDSFRTATPLMYQPLVITCAAMLMAEKFTKITITQRGGVPWYLWLDKSISLDEIQAAYTEMCQLYAKPLQLSMD